MENCRIECNDYNLCFKAGREADGLRVGRPCENIVIHHCKIGVGDGVTIGSETSGGMRNIEITDIKMDATKNEILLKSARNRGGLIENIRLNNFEMVNVPNIFNFQFNWNPAYSHCSIPDTWKGDVPDFWRILAEPVKPDERGIPEFRNIEIANILARCLKSEFICS